MFGFVRAVERLQCHALIVVRKGVRRVDGQRLSGGVDPRLIAAELDQRGAQAVEKLDLLRRELEGALKRRHLVLGAPGNTAGLGQVGEELSALWRVSTGSG